MATLHIFPDPKFIEDFIASITPSRAKTEALGVFLVQQIRRRFQTAGASGNANWPPKWTSAVGAPDGRAILTGPSGRLLESWQSYGEDNSAVAFSDVFYAQLQQNGGKIVAKKAKALFIPLTDRAQSSQRIAGQQAAHYRADVGKFERAGASMLPLRVATRGKKVSRGGVKYFAPLVKGRLKDGRLQKWDDDLGEYVDGIPDFIFLAKVEVKARPMLPDSAAEQTEQGEFIADMLNPQAAT